MTREEVLDFLNANNNCYLATVEDGEPRVRGMSLYRADDTGIIFLTSRSKDLAKQLQACPKVELCSFDPKTGMQIRVRGSVEFVDDAALKEEIIANRPFLKHYIESAGYDVLVVFRIRDGIAILWDRGGDLDAKTLVRL